MLRTGQSMGNTEESQRTVDISLMRLDHVPFIVTNRRKMAVWSDIKELLLWCPSPSCNVVLSVLKCLLGYPDSDMYMHPCSQLEQLSFLRHYMIVSYGTLLVDLESLRDNGTLTVVYDMVVHKHKKSKEPVVLQCSQMLKDMTRKYANTSFKIPVNVMSKKCFLPAVRRADIDKISTQPEAAGCSHGQLCRSQEQAESSCQTLVPLSLLAQQYPDSEGFLEEVLQLYMLGRCAEKHIYGVCQCTVEEGVQLTRFLASQNGYEETWECLTSHSVLISWAEFWKGFMKSVGTDQSLNSRDICVVTLNCQTEEKILDPAANKSRTVSSYIQASDTSQDVSVNTYIQASDTSQDVSANTYIQASDTSQDVSVNTYIQASDTTQDVSANKDSVGTKQRKNYLCNLGQDLKMNENLKISGKLSESMENLEMSKSVAELPVSSKLTTTQDMEIQKNSSCTQSESTVLLSTKDELGVEDDAAGQNKKLSVMKEKKPKKKEHKKHKKHRKSHTAVKQDHLFVSGKASESKCDRSIDRRLKSSSMTKDVTLQAFETDIVSDLKLKLRSSKRKKQEQSKEDTSDAVSLAEPQDAVQTQEKNNTDLNNSASQKVLTAVSFESSDSALQDEDRPHSMQPVQKTTKNLQFVNEGMADVSKPHARSINNSDANKYSKLTQGQSEGIMKSTSSEERNIAVVPQDKQILRIPTVQIIDEIPGNTRVAALSRTSSCGSVRNIDKKREVNDLAVGSVKEMADVSKIHARNINDSYSSKYSKLNQGQAEKIMKSTSSEERNIAVVPQDKLILRIPTAQIIDEIPDITRVAAPSRTHSFGSVGNIVKKREVTNLAVGSVKGMADVSKTYAKSIDDSDANKYNEFAQSQAKEIMKSISSEERKIAVVPQDKLILKIPTAQIIDEIPDITRIAAPSRTHCFGSVRNGGKSNLGVASVKGYHVVWEKSSTTGNQTWKARYVAPKGCVPMVNQQFEMESPMKQFNTGKPLETDKLIRQVKSDKTDKVEPEPNSVEPRDDILPRDDVQISDQQDSVLFHKLSSQEDSQINRHSIGRSVKQADVKLADFTTVTEFLAEKDLMAEDKGVKPKKTDINLSEFMKKRIIMWQDVVGKKLNINSKERLIKSADSGHRRQRFDHHCRPASSIYSSPRSRFEQKGPALKTAMSALYSRDKKEFSEQYQTESSPSILPEETETDSDGYSIWDQQSSTTMNNYPESQSQSVRADSSEDSLHSPPSKTLLTDQIDGDAMLFSDCRNQAYSYGSSSSTTPDIYDEFARKKTSKLFKVDTAPVKSKPATKPLCQPVARKSMSPLEQSQSKSQPVGLRYQQHNISLNVSSDTRQTYGHADTSPSKNLPYNSKALSLSSFDFQEMCLRETEESGRVSQESSCSFPRQIVIPHTIAQTHTSANMGLNSTCGLLKGKQIYLSESDSFEQSCSMEATDERTSLQQDSKQTKLSLLDKMTSFVQKFAADKFITLKGIDNVSNINELGRSECTEKHWSDQEYENLYLGEQLGLEKAAHVHKCIPHTGGIHTGGIHCPAQSSSHLDSQPFFNVQHDDKVTPMAETLTHQGTKYFVESLSQAKVSDKTDSSVTAVPPDSNVFLQKLYKLKKKLSQDSAQDKMPETSAQVLLEAGETHLSAHDFDVDETEPQCCLSINFVARDGCLQETDEMEADQKLDNKHSSLSQEVPESCQETLETDKIIIPSVGVTASVQKPFHKKSFKEIIEENREAKKRQEQRISRKVFWKSAQTKNKKSVSNSKQEANIPKSTNKQNMTVVSQTNITKQMNLKPRPKVLKGKPFRSHSAQENRAPFKADPTRRPKTGITKSVEGTIKVHIQCNSSAREQDSSAKASSSYNTCQRNREKSKGISKQGKKECDNDSRKVLAAFQKLSIEPDSSRKSDEKSSRMKEQQTELMQCVANKMTDKTLVNKQKSKKRCKGTKSIPKVSNEADSDITKQVSSIDRKNVNSNITLSPEGFIDTDPDNFAKTFVKESFLDNYTGMLDKNKCPRGLPHFGEASNFDADSRAVIVQTQPTQPTSSGFTSKNFDLKQTDCSQDDSSCFQFNSTGKGIMNSNTAFPYPYNNCNEQYQNDYSIHRNSPDVPSARGKDVMLNSEEDEENSLIENYYMEGLKRVAAGNHVQSRPYNKGLPHVSPSSFLYDLCDDSNGDSYKDFTNYGPGEVGFAEKLYDETYIAQALDSYLVSSSPEDMILNLVKVSPSYGASFSEEDYLDSDWDHCYVVDEQTENRKSALSEELSTPEHDADVDNVEVFLDESDVGQEICIGETEENHNDILINYDLISDRSLNDQLNANDKSKLPGTESCCSVTEKDCKDDGKNQTCTNEIIPCVSPATNFEMCRPCGLEQKTKSQESVQMDKTAYNMNEKHDQTKTNTKAHLRKVLRTKEETGDNIKSYSVGSQDTYKQKIRKETKGKSSKKTKRRMWQAKPDKTTGKAKQAKSKITTKYVESDKAEKTEAVNYNDSDNLRTDKHSLNGENDKTEEDRSDDDTYSFSDSSDEDYNPVDDISDLDEEYDDDCEGVTVTRQKDKNNTDREVSIQKSRSSKKFGPALKNLRKKLQKKYDVKTFSPKKKQSYLQKPKVDKEVSNVERSIVREFCSNKSRDLIAKVDKIETSSVIPKAETADLPTEKLNTPEKETSTTSVTSSCGLEFSSKHTALAKAERKKLKSHRSKQPSVKSLPDTETYEVDRAKQEEEMKAAEGFIQTQKLYYEILKRTSLDQNKEIRANLEDEENGTPADESKDQPRLDELGDVIEALPVHGERPITRAISDAEKALEGTGSLEDLLRDREEDLEEVESVVEEIDKQCRYQMVEDEDHIQLGGVAFYKEFTFPFVYINGYKYTPLKDVQQIFVSEGCSGKCTIPRQVLHKHKALTKSFSSWEQVYKLELIRMKQKPSVRTGDMLLKLDTVISGLPAVVRDIVRQHKGTKLKWSQNCNLAVYDTLLTRLS